MDDFSRASREWFWEMDAELRFTWFSDECEALSGISPSRMLGRTRLELGCADKDRRKFEVHLKILLARKPFRDFCYLIQTDDGGTADVSVSGFPIFDSDGSFLGYRGTGINVTAWVSAEREARQAQQRLRDAVESISDGFALYDAEDKLVLCNTTFRTALAKAGDLLDPGVSWETLFKTLVKRGDIQPLEGDPVQWLEEQIELHRAGPARRSYKTNQGQWVDVREYMARDGSRVIVRTDITDLLNMKETLLKLSRAVEQSSAAVIITNANGAIEYVNPRFTELTGYTREEVLMQNPRILKSGQQSDHWYQKLWATISSGSDWSGELLNRRKDGTLFWAHATISPVQAENGTITHYIGIENDKSAEKMVEENLRASEDRYRSLIETSALGVLIDISGKPVFANSTCASIFGYDSIDELNGLPSVENLFAGGDIAKLNRCRGFVRKNQKKTNNCDLQVLKKDGSKAWIRVHMNAIRWKGISAIQSIIVDNTLQKLYENRLHYQANYDLVTDLPNRSLALERLHTAIVRARRRRHGVAILFIDIDHFKKINDTRGHQVGDQFLRSAGTRIKAVLREEDTLARLGGDEFVVILPEIHAESDAIAVSNKIRDSFIQPFRLDGQETFVTISIGLSFFPEHGEDPDTLMRNADVAMYLAKDEGRGTERLFTSELSDRAHQRMRLEHALRSALKHREFSLMYQPIIGLETGEIVGAEALLRWHNPQLGQVAPDQFIQTAEDTGLIVPIGAWVLSTACQQAKTWRELGNSTFRISVNVSSRQFRDPSLLETVESVLIDNALSNHCLELEITESLMMDGSADIKGMVNALADAGIRLAVDDFGTGYSSLSYLNRFPVHTLKIDRSFVAGLLTDVKHAALVDAIIVMAHRLGLKVVAEGVETHEQRAILDELGCDLIQGYLTGRPLSPDDFSALLHRKQSAKTLAL
ncbi:MAG: EAL domain-containing protein [Hyphomicrobiales bacterium]|nr:EAL domain-containing protein [Hyphomicrobiales bacterium]